MSDIVAYVLGASRIDAHVDSQSIIGISSVGIQGPLGAQGPQGIPGPTGSSQVSTDPGNLAVLGSDNQVLVDANHVTPVAIGAQATLVSGSNIKTINSESLLGGGNLSLQTTLVSGTTIRTINNTSLLGSGDIAVQAPLISGTNIKTINSVSLLGSGNISVQPTLVSGTSIKTVDGVSLLGSGDIATVKSHTELTNVQGGAVGEYYHLTAAQLAEIQSFQNIITITKSLTLTTEWADTGITATDLTTGTYVVQLYANDEGNGGTNNNEYYSGTMSWYSGDTVSSTELPTDEIQLHRAGNSGEGGLYLRTFRTSTFMSGTKLKLQIYSNTATPSASNYVFKFRRII